MSLIETTETDDQSLIEGNGGLQAEATGYDTTSVDLNDSVQAEHLFVGDTGQLPLDTRRALVQLLAGPSIDGRRHSKLWSALLRDELIIRSRLSELLLDVVVDNDQQVAFIRQADSEDIEIPSLLRRSQLTFIDSALILFLRRQLAQADANAERAVVSLGEMQEHLIVYERSANTDRAGFIKRVNASVEKLKKNNILQLIRSASDRFEISPTLKLLFSAAEITALTKLYNNLAGADEQTENSSAESDNQQSSQAGEVRISSLEKETW